MLAALVGVGGQLDAAGLAPPADLDLRLDDDRVADPVGGGDGVVDGGDRLAGRHRDAVPGEELLALVLVQVHRRRETVVEARLSSGVAELAARLGTYRVSRRDVLALVETRPRATSVISAIGAPA